MSLSKRQGNCDLSESSVRNVIEMHHMHLELFIPLDTFSGFKAKWKSINVSQGKFATLTGKQRVGYWNRNFRINCRAQYYLLWDFKRDIVGPMFLVLVFRNTANLHYQIRANMNFEQGGGGVCLHTTANGTGCLMRYQMARQDITATTRGLQSHLTKPQLDIFLWGYLKEKSAKSEHSETFNIQ